MSLIAIHFFTFVFNLFGVQAIPAHLSDHWAIQKHWLRVGEQFEFQASSAKVPEYCRQHPNEELIFPQVVHSSQILKLDGQTIATMGKPDYSAGSPFYQQLTVNCDKLLAGDSVEWSVRSYSFFFSRLNDSPYFSKDDSAVNFLNVAMNVLAFGILLALAIFTFIIFKNRVADRLTYSVSIGSLFLSIYFANCANLLLGFNPTMLMSHKIADLAVWIGIFLFYYSYEVDGYSTPFYSRLAKWACGIGLAVIAIGQTGDVVQLGTILPMAPMALAFVAIMRKIAIKARTSGYQINLASKLFSVMSFLVFGLNDIFHIMGIINTGMVLSFGIIGCIFGLSISVAQEINFTYQERDEFRKELEAWAPPFILKALKYEKIKFPIRRDLAAITYDIIDSSKYHDTFVDGRPIRAVILQGFSETIIRNGGWRESHSGDSAYAHFGVLKSELAANVLAYRSAIAFKEFLGQLNQKHGLNVECGIGLHVATDVLINVHSISLQMDQETIQQKSFDTTSTDVDLVHRIESFIHLLPGTNVAMSEKFVRSLNFGTEGFVHLGRFKLKGQKELTNIYILPNPKVSPEILQHYFQQSA
jgi:class 3 adenylate cyclase